MREAIKSHGQPTPLNAPDREKENTLRRMYSTLMRGSETTQHFCSCKNRMFFNWFERSNPTHKEDKICTSMTKNQT